MKSKNALVKALIERGADRIPHSGRSFLDHLVGTHDLLEIWGADPKVCRAGLFHSVYGTEFFRGDFNPPWSRDEVIGLIGLQAEKLAFLFSQVQRDVLKNLCKIPIADEELIVLPMRKLGTAIRINTKTLRALILIYSANQEEQQSRFSFNNLSITRTAKM